MVQMIILTERQKTIVQQLLSQYQPMTVDTLAKHYSVSARTIRSDLEQISSFLHQEDLLLLREPGKGVSIAGRASQLVEMREKLAQPSSRSMSPTERVLFIAVVLLVEKTATMQTLADRCSVNKMTISRDLDTLSSFLAENQLALLRHAGRGLTLTGEEKDLRELFRRILNQEVKGRLRLGQLNVLDSVAAYLYQSPMGGFFTPAAEILAALENNLGVDYVSRERLTTCLAFCLMRAKRGKTPECQPRPEVEQSMEYPVLQQVLSDKGITDQYECVQIEELLLSSKITLRKESIYNKATDREEHVEEIARYMLDEIKSILNLQLTQEEERASFERLYVHLKVALFRVQHNILVNASMLDELKLTIPLIYELAKQIVARCEKRFGIAFENEETFFIALHIASVYEVKVELRQGLDIVIVCNFGLVTSNALKNRLLRMLPVSNIIGPFPVAKGVEYLRTAEKLPDLVVSSIPLPKDIEAIIVSPLLESEDAERINEIVMQKYYENQCRFFTQAYLQYFNRNSVVKLSSIIPLEQIVVADRCESWQQAIYKTAEPLLAKQLLEPRYVESILGIIKKHGNYMLLLPEIAFVHAGTEDGIRENCCAILALHRPVLFGVKNPTPVRAVVLMGIRDRQDDSMLRIIHVFENTINRVALERSDLSAEMIHKMHSRGDDK